jgi:hypothetical protein
MFSGFVCEGRSARTRSMVEADSHKLYLSKPCTVYRQGPSQTPPEHPEEYSVSEECLNPT